MPITVKYPLDPTGVSPNNLVQGEVCTLVTRPVRSIAPMYGAFYEESMVVTDLDTGIALDNTQWYAGELYDVPTAKYGKAVYALVIIIDQSVSNNVSIKYQAVGGEYSICDTAIRNLMNTLDLVTRPASWPDIIHKPAEYPPSQHLHDAGDIYGFEYIVHAIDRVRAAVEFGDTVSHDIIYKYVDSSILSSISGMLGNVDNTHDIDKPVSTAQAAADQLILSYAKSYTDAKNALITAQSIGLGNVNNTSDMNKPVSTAQAAADAIALATAKSYADGLVVGLWDDRGSFNASVNTYPTTGGSGVSGTILKGDIWTISIAATSGPLNGLPVGSTIRAVMDTPGQVTTGWAIAEVGLGYVPYNSTNPANYISSGSSPSLVNLTLTGALTVYGEITSYYSDERLKQKVGSIRNALTSVCLLDGFIYRGNALAVEHGMTDTSEQVGLSAQQLQRVMPQAVAPAPFDVGFREDGTRYSISGENYLTAKYERVVPLLVEAIKDLKVMVDDVKSENLALRKLLEEYMGRA